MNQVLQNLALIMLTDFCRANSLDCAGTHVQKDGRGFTYSLRDRNGNQVAAITFHKSQVPTYRKG